MAIKSGGLFNTQPSSDEAAIDALQKKAASLLEVFKKLSESPAFKDISNQAKESHQAIANIYKDIENIQGALKGNGQTLSASVIGDVTKASQQLRDLERQSVSLKASVSSSLNTGTTSTAKNVINVGSSSSKVDAAPDFDQLSSKALSVQKSLASLGSSKGLGSIGAEARTAQNEAVKLFATIQSLEKEVAKNPGARIHDDLIAKTKAAEAELNKLHKQSQGLQSNAADKKSDGGSAFGSLFSSLGSAGPLAVIGAVAFGVKKLFSEVKEATEAYGELIDAQRVLGDSAKEAGISYDGLNDKAEKYAKLNTVSNTAGTENFSSVVRFLGNAGKTDQLDTFSKSFSDTAAARGFGGDKQGQILDQLIKGQGRGLAQLFGERPDAIFDRYAAGLHKTKDELTTTEKSQALFNETLKKGEVFNGEAEKRAGSLAGQIDSLGASFDNLKAKAGQKLENNGAGTVLGIINAALTGETNKAFDRFHGTDTDGAGDKLIAVREQAELDKAAQNRYDQDKKLRDGSKNQFRSIEDLAQFRAFNRINIEHSDYANVIGKTPKQLQDEATTVEKIIDDERQEVEKSVASLQKTLSKRIGSDDLAIVKAAAAEAKAKSGILGESGTELIEQADKKITELIKGAFDKLNALRKTASGLFDDFLIKNNQNNPFADFFIKARIEAEKLHETTSIIGKDAAASLNKAFEQSSQNQLKSLIFNNNLKALEFDQQARKLNTPDGQTSAEDTRSLNAFTAKLENTLSANQTSRDIKFYQNLDKGAPSDLGTITTKLNDVTIRLKEFTDKNKNLQYADRFINPNFDALLTEQSGLKEKQQSIVDDVFNQVTKIRQTSVSSPEGAAKLADAVLERIKTISPEVLADSKLSGTSQLRGFAVESLKDQQAFKDEQTKNQLEQIEASKLTKQFALEQLELLKQSKLKPEDYTRQYLAITDPLAQSHELSSGETVERSKQLLIAGQFQRDYQTQSIGLMSESRDFLKSLDSGMKNLISIAQTEGIKGLNQSIEINTTQAYRPQIPTR